MLMLIVSLVVLAGTLVGGLWIAGSLGLSGLLSLSTELGLAKALDVCAAVIWNGCTNFVLISLPLFILMGEVLFQTRYLDIIYVRASRLLRGFPGDLLQTNIFASTLFAACSGSSLASAAVIGSVAYPQLKERGYDKATALGSIVAGGTLGILIPPSIPMILYGALTDESIGRLYFGGIIPGLMLASMFGIQIAIVTRTGKQSRPRSDGEGGGFRDRVSALAGLWATGIIAVVVLGGIYAGVATATEVAAVGVVAAICITAASRKLTVRALTASLMATVKTSAMIMLLYIGSQIISVTIAYYNIPSRIVALVSSLGMSPLWVLAAITLLYFIMGMFFDGLSMIIITIPFVMPIITAAGFNQLWFGIYLVILIEISLITPPVGLNLYVVQGASGEPLELVTRGSLPFLIPLVLMLIILTVFPIVAMWLPGVMGG